MEIKASERTYTADAAKKISYNKNSVHKERGQVWLRSDSHSAKS